MAQDIPFTLPANRKDTHHLAQAIREAIAAGRWQPGQPLPTAAEFQSALGTGGYVPRTALRLLADEGVITLKKHVGAVVAERNAPRRNGRIAFISTLPSGNYYAAVHAHVLQTLFEGAGWEFVGISIAERDENDTTPDLKPLERHLADGIDLAICFAGSRQIAAALDAAHVRYIYEGGTGREFPNAEAVFNLELDSSAAVGQLARHWTGQDVKDVLVVDFEHLMPRTVITALVSSGIRFRQVVARRPSRECPLQDVQRAGLQSVQRFFSSARNREKPPDAIFFYDDYLAAGGLIALAATGLRVPEDIRVATLANRGFGPVWFKPLTRLEYDPVENARLIGNYVLKLLAGKKAAPPTLQLKFIEGKT